MIIHPLPLYSQRCSEGMEQNSTLHISSTESEVVRTRSNFVLLQYWNFYLLLIIFYKILQVQLLFEILIQNWI